MPKRNNRSYSNNNGPKNKRRKYNGKGGRYRGGGAGSLQQYTNLRGILFTCPVKQQNKAKREALALVSSVLDSIQEMSPEEREVMELPEQFFMNIKNEEKKVEEEATEGEASLAQNTTAADEEKAPENSDDTVEASTDKDTEKPTETAASETPAAETTTTTEKHTSSTEKSKDAPPADATSSSTVLDASKSLKQELQKQNPCEALEAGVSGNFFIRVRDNIDPAWIIRQIIENIKENGLQSRFLSKMIPVSKMCHVKQDLIEKCLKMVVDHTFRHYTSLQFKRWKLDFHSKYNSAFKRPEVSEMTHSYVKRWHIVDLKNPEIVIFVYILGRVALIGSVTDYDSLYHLNFNRMKKELGSQQDQKDPRMNVSVFNTEKVDTTTAGKEEESTTASTEASSTSEDVTSAAQKNSTKKKRKKQNVGGIRLF